MFCRSLFVLLSVFFWPLYCLVHLRCTASDYPFSYLQTFVTFETLLPSMQIMFGYSSSRIVPEYYRTWVRLYLQLFVGGIMSYLHYLFLFMYGVVQRILCFVFVLFVIVLCTLDYQFRCLFYFVLPILYSIVCTYLDFSIYYLCFQFKSCSIVHISFCGFRLIVTLLTVLQFETCVFSTVIFILMLLLLLLNLYS